MKNCELVTLISVLACNIAEGKSEKEIAILASFFTQLGDTLTTLSALNAE